MNRVLIVDDDEELCDLMTVCLISEGFGVETVHAGEESIERALNGDFAVLVLDVMLPGISGFEVLRRLRGAASPGAQLPVLMLTACGDEVDRVLGLELGADDYLSKPFSSRELTARLRALVRRAALSLPHETAQAKRPVERLCIGDVELQVGARRIERNGVMLDLTSVEYSLLELLLQSTSEVVTREDIAQKILGRPLLPYDGAIDTHLCNLRRKLGPYPDGAERIKTVRGVGYIYTQPPPESAP